MPRKPFLLGFCCLLLIVTGICAEVPDAVKADEETLKTAGLGTDDAALLDFFRSKTLADADRDKIAALIRDLGADDFAVREKASSELVKIGETAAALLRQANTSIHSRMSRTTDPCTSVSLRSMPLWRKVSFSWLMPRRCSTVACRS